VHDEADDGAVLEVNGMTPSFLSGDVSGATAPGPAVIGLMDDRGEMKSICMPDCLSSSVIGVILTVSMSIPDCAASHAKFAEDEEPGPEVADSASNDMGTGAIGADG